MNGWMLGMIFAGYALAVVQFGWWGVICGALSIGGMLLAIKR